MPEKENETTVWKIQRYVSEERVLVSLLRTPSHCDVDAVMAEAMQKRKQFKVHVDFDGAQKTWRNNKTKKYCKSPRGQIVMTGFQYECLPYEEAKKKVHALGLKDVVEWRRWSRSPERPLDIPISPESTYENAGWKGMADWLGNRKKKRGSKLEKNEEENEDKKKDNERNNINNESIESQPH